MIFVDRREPDQPRNHHVSLAPRIANRVDPLAWRKGFNFDLAGKDGALFIIKQGEEWHLSQNGGIAGHWRLLRKNAQRGWHMCAPGTTEDGMQARVTSTYPFNSL